jgi:hypothetical protein
MKPNLKFELSVKDINIIETALRNKVGRRSQRIIEGEDPEMLQTEAKEILDLLGRIHHQKSWYRPKNGVYVGG